MAEGGKKKEEDDPRCLLLSEYCIKSMRIKPDKWVKLITNADYKVRKE